MDYIERQTCGPNNLSTLDFQLYVHEFLFQSLGVEGGKATYQKVFEVIEMATAIYEHAKRGRGYDIPRLTFLKHRLKRFYA
ncbi:hypothetical protein TWF281_001351 [Arthrobotrys megalospora]